MEGAVVIQKLAERFPDMQLADDEPAWKGSSMMRGPSEVLVSLRSMR
jgi:cytochrome P450